MIKETVGDTSHYLVTTEANESKQILLIITDQVHRNSTESYGY